MTAPERIAEPSPTLTAAVRRFLQAPRFAAVATLNPDGSPLQAIVWYRLDGDDIVFNSRVGRRWPGNLGRDPRVSIIVADAYDYVELRGEVEIDDDPETGLAVISDLARRYHPDKEVADAQIARFAKERRVTFRLRPRRVFARLAEG